MKSLFNKIVNELIDAGKIDVNDKELYTYGLEQGALMILNIITTLLIGFFFQIFWQSVLFMVVYLPLRSYAGGFHAKTQLNCYFLSMVLTSAVLLVIKFVPWTDFICVSVALGSGIIISILAPVEAKNKALDKIESAVYRKRTRLILTAESGIFLIMLLLGFHFILPCISTSLLALGIMLILGKVVNLTEAGRSIQAK